MLEWNVRDCPQYRPTPVARWKPLCCCSNTVSDVSGTSGTENCPDRRRAAGLQAVPGTGAPEPPPSVKLVCWSVLIVRWDSLLTERVRGPELGGNDLSITSVTFGFGVSAAMPEPGVDCSVVSERARLMRQPKHETSVIIFNRALTPYSPAKTAKNRKKGKAPECLS